MSEDKIYKHMAYKFFLENKNFKNNLNGGGIIKPDWIDMFLLELDQVYDPNYVITGSGAVVLYLNHFNNLTNGKFNELIAGVRLPNDIDFLYYCRGTNYEPRRSIGKFSRLQDSPQRSVTYVFNSSDALPNIIKSFDMTCLSMIPYVLIDKYKVLSLEKILSFYSDELEDNEMILSSNKNKMLELEQNMEDSKKKRKLSVFLDLESEYGTLEVVVDKTKNKLLALEAKINIINILSKNIKTEPDINSMYQLKYIPETKPVAEKQFPSRNLFSSNLVRKLLDSDFKDENESKDEDLGYESEHDDDHEIKPRTLFSSFGETPTKKPMLPVITSRTPKELSIHTPSKDSEIDNPDSITSTIKYTYVPYKIKFDFEDEV